MSRTQATIYASIVIISLAFGYFLQLLFRIEIESSKVNLSDLLNVVVTILTGIGVAVYVQKFLTESRAEKDFLIDEVKLLKAHLHEMHVIYQGICGTSLTEQRESQFTLQYKQVQRDFGDSIQPIMKAVLKKAVLPDDIQKLCEDFNSSLIKYKTIATGKNWIIGEVIPPNLAEDTDRQYRVVTSKLFALMVEVNRL